MMPASVRRVYRFVPAAFLIFWCVALRTPLCAQDVYWAPKELPKSHYIIDARVDLSPKGAIEHDTGETMTHSQYGMRINRQWVEERLKTAFVRNR